MLRITTSLYSAISVRKIFIVSTRIDDTQILHTPKLRFNSPIYIITFFLQTGIRQCCFTENLKYTFQTRTAFTTTINYDFYILPTTFTFLCIKHA